MISHQLTTRWFNLSSTDELTRVVLQTPHGSVEAYWPSHREPQYHEDMPPSAVAAMIGTRLREQSNYQTIKYKLEKVALILQHAGELDQAWYIQLTGRLQKQAERLHQQASRLEEQAEQLRQRISRLRDEAGVSIAR